MKINNVCMQTITPPEEFVFAAKITEWMSLQVILDKRQPCLSRLNLMSRGLPSSFPVKRQSPGNHPRQEAASPGNPRQEAGLSR